MTDSKKGKKKMQLSTNLDEVIRNYKIEMQIGISSSPEKPKN